MHKRILRFTVWDVLEIVGKTLLITIGIIGLCIILSSLLSGCATSGWSRSDKNLMYAGFIATGVDIAQTSNVHDNPDLVEGNSLLGSNPNPTNTAILAITGNALVVLAAEMIPNWRTAILSLYLGAEAKTVHRNYLVLNELKKK